MKTGAYLCGKMTSQRCSGNPSNKIGAQWKWLRATVVMRLGIIVCLVSTLSFIVSCNKEPSYVRIPVDRNGEWRIGETNYYVLSADYVVIGNRYALLQIMACVDFIPEKSNWELALQFARYANTNSCIGQFRGIKVDDAPVTFTGFDVALVQNPRLMSNACSKAYRYTITLAELGKYK